MKKEKVEKMRKSQTTRANIFLLLIFYTEKFCYFVRKQIWKNLVYTVTFALQFFRVAGCCKCSNKTPTPICIGLDDALLRPKILGN